MSRFETKSIKPNMGFFQSEKNTTSDEFLDMTAEDLLIQHHRKNADITYFNFASQNEADNMLFLVTQDKELIADLKMIKNNKKIDPKRTLDLFTEEKEQFSQISIRELLKDVDQNQADFHLSVDGRDYSFRLATATKVNKLISKIDIYVDEVENMSEYKDETTKIKI